MLECTCSDRTSLCPRHDRRPTAVTIGDVLAGCTCRVVDLLGQVTVVVGVTCPVHGAPAFRRAQTEAPDA